VATEFDVIFSEKKNTLKLLLQ